MMMFSLVDVSDYGKLNGVLVCDNNCVSDNILQEKIDEIKYQFEKDDQDWMIADIIKKMPSEWNVKWYNKIASIRV